MRYIIGIHALNLPCSLETSGEWHCSSMNWVNPKMKESSDSIFKDYGIETCNCVPENLGEYLIANTLRDILDLLESNQLPLAQGLEIY